MGPTWPFLLMFESRIERHSCCCIETLWTRVFTHVRPHSMGETRFFVLENHLKKKVWSRHLFLFYFKREKQNKKEKP